MNYYKSPLKVHELKVWVKKPPDIFQNLKIMDNFKKYSIKQIPNSSILRFYQMVENDEIQQSKISQNYLFCLFYISEPQDATIWSLLYI